MSNSSVGVALVTGASGGIGAVYADRLARRGYDLVLVARNEERLNANAARIAAETGRSAEVVVADLTRPSDVAAIRNRLADDASITMLVNNAGIALGGGLLDSGPNTVERLIGLNITAPTLLAAAAGKSFAARKAGTIVNIGSVVAFLPEMFEGVYSGSKSYILNLSQSLAAQLKEAGVRVQAVVPGPTRTDIWTHNGQDPDALFPGKVMTAEDLVDAALAGLDRGEVVTIPSLADENLWKTFEASRFAMAPQLAQRDVAPRYRP